MHRCARTAADMLKLPKLSAAMQMPLHACCQVKLIIAWQYAWQNPPNQVTRQPSTSRAPVPTVLPHLATRTLDYSLHGYDVYSYCALHVPVA
jgi:hypothetical protein